MKKKLNLNFRSMAVLLLVLTIGQGCERDTPRVTNKEELFAGTLQNFAGDKLVGTITINQKSITTSSDGAFSLLVPHAEKYVVNARSSGYLLSSDVYWRRGHGNLKIQLRPTEQFSFDAKMPLSQEDSRGTLIKLPADALLDANGQPPSGPVTLNMHTYNLLTERLVGDMSALETSGRPVALRSIGAVSAEFSDAQGNAYNLAPGKKATLSLRLPPGDSYKGSVPLWWYDTQQGVWRAEGAATVRDGLIMGEVSHFSQWNADFIVENSSCVQIKVDSLWFRKHAEDDGNGQMSVTLEARIEERQTFVKELVVNSAADYHVLYHLENFVHLRLHLPDGTFLYRINTDKAWERNPSEPDQKFPTVGEDGSFPGCHLAEIKLDGSAINSSPVIKGIALRQHRSSPSIKDAIQIELTVEGSSSKDYIATDEAGAYFVSASGPGRATVTASRPGYLSAQRKGVSLSGTGVVMLPEVQLLAGDVYRDDLKNCVTQMDTSSIIDSIGQVGLGVESDLFSDINGDKVVDFNDLALAAENGGKCGPTVW